MRTTALSFFTLLLAATLSSTVLAIKYDDVQMLCLVNKERAKKGLKPMGLDAKLTKAAKAHSQDQARTRKMSHSGSDGSKPSQRVSRAGYKWKSVAENVAYGYKSMEAVMKTWMNSPGHRANILGKSYTTFGSGMALAGSTPYFTQTFASDGSAAKNVPKCDGSDAAYGGADGADDTADAYGGADDSGDSYGGGEGGDDSYGGSKGGRKSGGKPRGGDDYSGGNNGESDSYGSQGGRKGGRRGGSKPSGGDYSNQDSGDYEGGDAMSGGSDKPTYGGKGQDGKDCPPKGGRGGSKSGNDY